MFYLFFTLITAILALTLWLGWRRYFLNRRERSLRHLLDGADALEQQLQECRNQMHDLQTQLVDLPEEMSNSVHQSLTIDAQVRAALRDLLSHRLWIKHHAEDATQQQLDQACTAIQQSRQLLTGQLQRLTAIGSDLARARALSSAPIRG